MNKRLTIEYKDKKYTLEFTRDSIRQMEADGFDINGAQDNKMPVSTIMGLWEGAFICHHPDVSKETKEELFDSLGDKEKLLEALTTMYSVPIESLTKEPKTKNAKWTGNW